MMQISRVVARQVAMRKPQEVTMTKSSQTNSRHRNSHLRLNDDLDTVDTLNACHDRLLGLDTRLAFFLLGLVAATWNDIVPRTGPSNLAICR